MLEQQRIEYLQAMGIQVWMPRKPVAHAAESLWLAGDELASNSQEVFGETFKAGHAADLLADVGSVAELATAQLKQANPEQANTVEMQPLSKRELSQSPSISGSTNNSLNQQAVESDVGSFENSDFVIPEFELHFALWPCGILWVSGQPFDQQDNTFQTSVSYSLLFSSVPQASYSHFKWPYIQGSSEDQSTAVALRALTAQWEFMSSQGARAWIAMDSSSLEWLAKVAAKPLFSVDEKEEIFLSVGKKQLWNALKTLPSLTSS